MTKKKVRLWARRMHDVGKWDFLTSHKICSICQKHYDEWGNNAEPVKAGRCCNRCNDLVVIPERIRRMQNAQT